MPELPDVEVYKKLFNREIVLKAIRDINVSTPSLLDNLTPEELSKQLKGKTIGHADRHAKYLFADVKGGPCMVMHFGLSGELEYAKDAKKNGNGGLMAITFDDGSRLVYTAHGRIFGKVTFAETREAFIKEKKLGPDAFEDLELDDFKKILAKSRGAIKAVLMDQHKIGGIGNVYADEILYQASVNPETPASSLGEEVQAKLYRAVMTVLEKAIDLDGDRGALPPAYLTRHRRKGERCPRCKSAIVFMRFGGRETYYCPVCQKK